MLPSTFCIRRCASAFAVCFALLWAGPVQAENHALIMWIGDYGNAKLDLPGIDLDAAIAKKIATAMGVPDKNITELANANLTRKNMATTLLGLIDRIRDGDKVLTELLSRRWFAADSLPIRYRKRCTSAALTTAAALPQDWRT